MLRPEYIFIWILFHLGAVELPKALSNRNKPFIPATENVKHLRYQDALNSYKSLDNVKLATEYKSLAIALYKLNKTDSALKVYHKMASKFPGSLNSYDLLNIAVYSRKLGNINYSDSIIRLLKSGEFSYNNIFDEINDTHFLNRSTIINQAVTSIKKMGFYQTCDHYGPIYNPKSKNWYMHTRQGFYDGLLSGYSPADKKPYPRVFKVNNIKDSVISLTENLREDIVNRNVELSYIDSMGNYYLSINNKFVNDSDQFLLQVYRYYYDNNTDKYISQSIPGLHQFYFNVSGLVLNSSRTKAVFTSDMMGSVGKSDLWVADVTWTDDGDMSIANYANLGPKVNTLLSEFDPFFVTDDLLAFSSDGHMGYGGSDIYFYCFSTNELSNAGPKINSNNNDIFPKYYNGTLYFSSENNNALTGVNYCEIPPEAIAGATLPFVPPSPEVIAAQNENSQPNLDKVQVKQAIESTLTKVKEENENKYKYAKNLSFVLMTDSERLETINHMDSSFSYKDFRFMTLFHVDGDFVIEKEFEKELKLVSALLKKKPDWGIEIRSYTDSRGPKTKNKKLSQSRADYVANFLEKEGVNKLQIRPIGFGESMLINHCADGVPCTEDEHRQNRRTELILTPVFYWKK